VSIQSCLSNGSTSTSIKGYEEAIRLCPRSNDCWGQAGHPELLRCNMFWTMNGVPALTYGVAVGAVEASVHACCSSAQAAIASRTASRAVLRASMQREA
jgi:hypothetical protein